jgi:hypothetical protein
MRAGEIQFEGVHPSIMATLDDLAPRVLVVFLHHRCDQDPLGMFTFVPGGPDPITKGFVNFRPSTVVARVLMFGELV